MGRNEIMAREIDMQEEVVQTGPSKGFKIAAGIGIAALVGTLAYKFIVKPMRAKKKAQAAEEAIDYDYEELEDEVE